MSLVIETTLGDLTVDLYTNKCPLTCYNFMKLCKAKYYNMVLFHSVIKDFLAQTGDPTGKGDGGTSIFGLMEGKEKRWYKDVRLQPGMKHSKPGLLSMVHCGDNLFGSQFLITLGTDLHSLDGEHIIFGEVVDGEDILLKFNETITDSTHRPYKDIRITHTVIVDDPFEDPEMEMPPSPAINEEELKNSRIAPHEADSEDGLSETEKQERLKDKEAKAQATILEIVGDLPSYDVAPPENVLFVCRLNPVTTEEDLEIIFSRFGKIISAEVIRDRKTGDSLQYAFIEFEDKQSCENAYMKMEGVLIDERRIHVDFSQSVSKRIKWNGKGRGVILSKEEEELQQKEKRRGRKSSPGRDSAGCSSWDIPRDGVSCETSNRDSAKRDEQESKKDKCRMNSRKDKRREEQHDSQRKSNSQEHSKYRKDPREPSKRRQDSRESFKHSEDHRETSKHREDTREHIKRREDTRKPTKHREDPRESTKCREDPRNSNKHREDSWGPTKHREGSLEPIKHREDLHKTSEYREDPQESFKGREESLGKSSYKSSHRGKHYEKQKHLVHTITTERATSQCRINKRKGSDSSEEERSSNKDHRNSGLLSREHKKSEDRRSDKEEKNASQRKEFKRHNSDESQKEIANSTFQRSEKQSGCKHVSATKENNRDGSSLHKGEKVSYTSQGQQSKDSKAIKTVNKKMKVDESEKEYVSIKVQKKKQHSSCSTSSDSSDAEVSKGKTSEKTRKSTKIMKLFK